MRRVAGYAGGGKHGAIYSTRDRLGRNRSNDGHFGFAAKLAGCRGKNGVAIVSGMRGVNGPRESVVGHLRNLRAFGFRQRRVRRHKAERRMSAKACGRSASLGDFIVPSRFCRRDDDPDYGGVCLQLEWC